MAVNTLNFTTGPATLPDIGELSYNGCIFSPLFESNVSGNAVKDRANRTVKFVEYTIVVDGYVTLPTGASSINSVTSTLRELLQAQAGQLKYKGRGLDIEINAPGGGGKRDVVWGPIPDILDFQPLGGGRSAKIRWQVKVALTEQRVARLSQKQDKVPIVFLQFNYETSVTYGEDGYSGLSIKGTLEIPMTRNTQAERSVPYTVDDLRTMVERRVMNGIDLSRFRLTNREFAVSRDKRTLEWSVSAEERPYMDMPPDCTIARGTYNVRPAKAGMGLALWLCTLRGTYTVRADAPRRIAWMWFLAMLRLRMAQSEHGKVPDMPKGDEKRPLWERIIRGPALPFAIPLQLVSDLLKKQKVPVSAQKAWLIDFSFDEGLYLDSKIVTFSATWRLATTFSHILIASGIWTKLAETTVAGENLWGASMKDISGSRSWLTNTLDPNVDVILDFGGP